MRRLFPSGQICSQAENLLADILLYHRDAFPLSLASFLHVTGTPSEVYIFPSSRGEKKSGNHNLLGGKCLPGTLQETLGAEKNEML